MLNIRPLLRIDVLLTARCLLLLAMIALMFSPPLSTLIDVLLLVLFVGAPSLRQRLRSALAQPLVRFSLLLLAWFIVGVLYSANSWFNSVDFLISSRKLLLLPLAIAVFDEIKWKYYTAWLLLATLVLCALCAIISYTFDISWYKYPVGIVIKDRISQGMLFAVGAFVALGLLRSSALKLTTRHRYALALAIVLLVGATIFVTPGRSGYLALLVLTPYALFVFWQKSKLRLFLMGVIPLVLVTALALSPVAYQRIQLGLHEAETYQDAKEYSSIGYRLVFLQNTVKIIQQRPWFGYGTGGFKIAYGQQVADEQGWRATISDNPHNQYLWIFAEHGVFGFVLFLCFIAAFFRQNSTQPWRSLGLGVLIAWCATSLFNSHFFTHTEGRFLLIWCGIMLATTHLPIPGKQEPVDDKLPT